MAQVTINLPTISLPAALQSLLAWPRRLLAGTPQVWAGRWVALIILASTSVQQITHWDVIGDKGKNAGDSRYYWIGLPPDNRVFVFYAAIAIIVVGIGMVFWLRNRIDPRHLRNLRTVGLAILQIVIGVGILIGAGTLEMQTGISPSSLLGDIVETICFWNVFSGLARFMLLLRNPAKVR